MVAIVLQVSFRRKRPLRTRKPLDMTRIAAKTALLPLSAVATVVLASAVTTQASDPQPRKTTDVSQLTLRTRYGSTEECDHLIRDIFVVWWDKNFDYSDGAKNLLDSLVETRKYCLETFSMADPKGSDRYYYNVYIHNGKDLFPDNWAQGQGTDRDGYPYLTIPSGLTDPTYSGHVHEGFHIYQYNATSPGFAYRGDSQWFVEATANWYVAVRRPDNVGNFICGGAVTANPHVPMWYSFRNKQPGDKNNWQRDCHQYGMNILLYYLTEVGKVPRELMANGFYAGEKQSPQEYLYRQVGAEKMCDLFADWAAHTAADFDYMAPAAVARLKQEYARYGTPSDARPVVKTFVDAGTDGQWFRPDEDCVTRSWGYNVYKIANGSAADYTFAIEGDAKGADKTPAAFRARIVVKAGEKRTYYDLDLKNARKGEKTVSVRPADEEIIFVVAATPEHFTGNQTFSYKIKIDKKPQ